jgi:hypothetical protein
MLKMSEVSKDSQSLKLQLFFASSKFLGFPVKMQKKNQGLYQSVRTFNSDLKIFGCFRTFNSELYILNLFSVKLWSKMGNKFEN